MSLIIPVEQMEDSEVLGKVPEWALIQYLEESVPGADRVDVFREHLDLSMIFRVVYQGKNVQFRLDRDDHVFTFRLTVDKALEKLQEELDKDSEVDPSPVVTEPTHQYSPETWAKKVAEKAMRSVEPY
jgi:hypothetical protein